MERLPVNYADFARSRDLNSRLARVIPGGAHTYARGIDQYPEGMAPVLTHGCGAQVWDADGNEFIEYGMGLRGVTLGHAHPEVTASITESIARGTSFSRPSVAELESAEIMLAELPGADMVKFAKNGSDVTTAAVRLARAVTGRKRIAVCNQPFFAVDDWFIGTTAMNAGIPGEIAGLTASFTYNDLVSLENLLAEGDIACVIMEAATSLSAPDEGFLEGVRALCDKAGTLLVFDEIITGFRWHRGGAQRVYGVIPDLSCWGKAMGNGFAIAALAGKREFMELGGLNTDQDRVFLLSTTNGPEAVGLAAFRAVDAVYRNTDPVQKMEALGAQLVEGVNEVTSSLGIDRHLYAAGRPSCAMFITRGPDGEPSQPYRTLFLQEMITRGVLGQSFVISAAHTSAQVEKTIEAVSEAALVYQQALEAGTTDRFLSGQPVAPAIRRVASRI